MLPFERNRVHDDYHAIALVYKLTARQANHHFLQDLEETLDLSLGAVCALALAAKTWSNINGFVFQRF